VEIHFFSVVMKC